MSNFNINLIFIELEKKIIDFVKARTSDIKDNITYSILPKLNLDSLKSADIIFIDNLDILNCPFKLHFDIIFIGNSQECSLLSKTTLSKLDGVICVDEPENLLEFRFESVFKNIIEKQKLFYQENLLDTLIDSVPELIWFKDLKGEHLKVNNSFCQSVGKSKAQIEGRGHYYIWDITPDEYDKGEFVCLESELEVIQAGKTCVFDEVVKSKQGLRRFKTYKSPVRDKSNNIIGTCGVAHDVTECTNKSIELDFLLNNLPFSILVVNKEGLIIQSNNVFQKTFHKSNNHIIDSSYIEWKNKNLNLIQEKNDLGEYSVTYNCEEHAKTIFSLTEKNLYDVFEQKTGLFIIFKDITNLHNQTSKIKELALLDILTNTYNRRFLFEYTNANLGRPCTLFFLDLDNFKQINDILGHNVGDQILKDFSSILTRFFENNIVVRFGGDEFIVLIDKKLSNVAINNLTSLLLNKIDTYFEKLNSHVMVTASIGTASTSNLKSSDKLNELINIADIAMYANKNTDNVF